MLARTGALYLAMLLTTGGLLGAAPAASADGVTCSLNAVAGNGTPGVGYSFSGSADCQYLDTTGAGAGSVYATTAALVSSGDFGIDICPSWWFFSNWNLPPDDAPDDGTTNVNFIDPRATDITAMKYKIRFTAGLGQMAIREVNSSPTSGGHGAILLSPPACGAGAFAVSGSFGMAIA